MNDIEIQYSLGGLFFYFLSGVLSILFGFSIYYFIGNSTADFQSVLFLLVLIFLMAIFLLYLLVIPIPTKVPIKVDSKGIFRTRAILLNPLHIEWCDVSWIKFSKVTEQFTLAYIKNREFGKISYFSLNAKMPYKSFDPVELYQMMKTEILQSHPAYIVDENDIYLAIASEKYKNIVLSPKPDYMYALVVSILIPIAIALIFIMNLY